MIRVFKSKSHRKGLLGEILVCKKLESVGFVSRETNFSCRTGEIDLIVQKEDCIYYIEVKSVYINYSPLIYNMYAYPEQNVSQRKMHRFLTTIEYYSLISKEKLMDKYKHIVAIAFVIINSNTKKYCICFTGNVS